MFESNRSGGATSHRSGSGERNDSLDDIDAVDAEHNPGIARRTSLADLRRYAEGPPSTRTAPRAPLHVGPATGTKEEANAQAPVLSGGHGTREIKIEFGDGTVTGGITATLEYGKTGVALGPDQIKALENTSAVQLNGLKTKLESAVLNGEIEGDLFEGLKISFEANARKAGVDSEGEVEVDLMTITVKLVGDASHLLNAGPNVTLAIDGNLSIALGDKLAAQLSSFIVAQLEQQTIAKEMDEIRGHLDDNIRKLKDLEAKADLLESRGAFDEAAKLRDEAFQHRLQTSTAKQQLDGLSRRLRNAKSRADKAIGKLQSKVAKQVAKAMEKKAVKFIANKLAKLVPVLNIASTVIDVIELVVVLTNLIERDFGGQGPGDDSGKPEDGAGGGKRKTQNTPTGSSDAIQKDGIATTDARDGAPEREGASAANEAEVAKARNSLAPAARAIVDALTTKARAGATLNADHIKMIGLLVPHDLNADELTELLAMLRESGPKARTPEQVIEAVSMAVRALRSRNGTVKVNGQARNDLSEGAAEEEGSHGPAASDRPVTSPNDIAGPTRAIEVVRGGDPGTIGRWFQAADAELVWTPEGEAWRSEHVRTELAPGTILDAVRNVVTNVGPGTWNLEVQFWLQNGLGSSEVVRHRFMVYLGGEDDGVGAKVGDLKFEGYIVVGDAF